jgi:hypothetical protein
MVNHLLLKKIRTQKKHVPEAEAHAPTAVAPFAAKERACTVPRGEWNKRTMAALQMKAVSA